MKIIGFFDNYKPVVGNRPEDALIQLTDVSLLRNGKPFFVPDDGHEYRAYPTLALKICRLGKTIPTRFASRYYTECAPALNIRDLTVLNRLRELSYPWTQAVAFDYSAPIGEFRSAPEILSGQKKIIFRQIDSEGIEATPSIEFDVNQLHLSPDEIIASLSTRFTLKDGDIIFVGYSPQSFLLSSRHTIEAGIGDDRLLTAKIR